MFNELVESTAYRKNANKRWAVVMSGAFQTVSLIVLILIPLIYTQALPNVVLSTALLAPASPVPSTPPAGEVLKKPPKQPARLLEHDILHEPTRIPTKIGMLTEGALPPESSAAMMAGPLSTDLLQNFGAEPVAAIPPTPPSPPSNATVRIKQGGQVQAAKIISQSSPVYPALARQARIQGNVVLHAVVDKDGRVSELEVISGHPLLVKAAFDAVKQWRYQPTLLNNEPVEVDTTITVAFVLGVYGTPQ